MVVAVSVWIYLKPSDEIISLEKKFEPDKIREKGKELKSRLARAAEIGELLIKNKWKYCKFMGPGYSVMFEKKISKTEAEKELGKLGILKEVHIEELEEE